MATPISVRFNDDDIKILSQRISDSGLTQSDFIRNACLNTRIIILDPAHKLFTELTQLISCINDMNELGIKKKGLRKEAENICTLLQSLLTDVKQISNNSII